MGAGDGAAEQSRLAAERVARLKRRLDQAEHSTKALDAGAAGAEVVADKLSELVPRGWYVLHDVHWPGRPKANLDHVLVGPGGVVVVDSKNWTGEVRVASGVLWQGRYARTQAVEGALAQCAAVASVLSPPHRRLVRPLICMAGQPDIFGVTDSDVAVAGSQRVVGAIEALPAVLDQQAVVGLYEQLGQQLTHEQEPGITALRNVSPGTVVRPAGALPPAGRQPGQRAGVAPGARTGAPGGSARRGRNAKARQRGGTSGAALALLAVFVIFAVYILPYLGH
ncbi:NERD domain-containing protein [Arthrobacter liuii]|uniref:NERD domain-containing protein n=1 Tax=Arthrobacter liuii TaxID=1476996 RepID=A0ABQ2AR11_9MICC|nr:NERD domain-containing protein [Arthrobacter liuii]GGH95791.1 hypothetical protein GCM10007170_22140 [Arthrobacter liuii]